MSMLPQGLQPAPAFSLPSEPSKTAYWSPNTKEGGAEGVATGADQSLAWMTESLDIMDQTAIGLTASAAAFVPGGAPSSSSSGPAPGGEAAATTDEEDPRWVGGDRVSSSVCAVSSKCYYHATALVASILVVSLATSQPSHLTHPDAPQRPPMPPIAPMRMDSMVMMDRGGCMFMVPEGQDSFQGADSEFYDAESAMSGMATIPVVGAAPEHRSRNLQTLSAHPGEANGSGCTKTKARDRETERE